MNCQFCGAANTPGDQFCGNCGARMPVAAAQDPPSPPPPAPGAPGRVPAPACHACGAEVPAGDPFCGHCGARQGSAGPAPGQWASATAVGAAGPRAWEAPPGAIATGSVALARPYAGFWIRFGAYLLDSLFSLLIALIPAIIGAAVAIAIVEAGQDPPTTVVRVRSAGRRHGRPPRSPASSSVPTPFFIAYWCIATALGGGWGKRICGIRIVKMDSGERPGYGSGGIR